MKKFVRISLTAAGALAAIGCVLCLVSGILRVGDKAAYENNKYDVYVAERIEEAGETMANAGLSRLGRILQSAGQQTLEKRTGTDGSKKGDPERLTVNNTAAERTGYGTSLEAKDIENLHLNFGAGTFVVEEKGSADGLVDIYIKGVGGCDFYVENKTLYVEGFKGVTVIGSRRLEDNIITIRFPEGMKFDEVELEAGAGRMDISSIEAGEISTVVGAGELFMERIRTKKLSAEVGAGTVIAEEAYATDVDLNVNLGACIYEGAITRELDAECSMGSLELKLEGREEDHNYEIECSAGNVEMNGTEYTAVASKRRIDNGAESNFEISCSMGDIIVHFEE